MPSIAARGNWEINSTVKFITHAINPTAFTNHNGINDKGQNITIANAPYRNNVVNGTTMRLEMINQHGRLWK